MVDDIKPHIICITEHNDITDAELGLEGYVMFRKDRIGKKGGGVLLYTKDTIPAYEVQLQDEVDCNEAIWCKPNRTTKHLHNAISEVSKGDCITMGILTTEILNGIHNRAQG